MLKIQKIMLAISILSLIVVNICLADIYSWTDENGIKHFSNTPVTLDKKAEIAVQNEKRSDPNETKDAKSTTSPNKTTKKLDGPENKKSESKGPEKKYSPEELKKIDKEIQSTWGKMKDALKQGKIKDK